MNNKKIGMFISKLRKEKNWTQVELAEKLYVDRTVVSKWERGVYIPNTELLFKMQELFDVSINELLFGERKTKNNSIKVDSIPLEIIKAEKKKRKKILIIGIIVILGLLFSFLTYYFINNFNSIKVYKIEGENEEFAIRNGILVFSKEKSYFRVGNLELKKNQNVSNVKLYFKKNNMDNLIFEGSLSHLDNLYENIFNYNEYFEYNDLEFIINNLKLDVKLEDGSTNTLELKLKKMYENSNIFNKYKKPISDGESNIVKEIMPEYIKQNFNYNKSSESYERINNNIKEEYFYNVNVYLITIQNEEIEEQLFYGLDSNTLEYISFSNDDQIDQYIYDFKSNSCVLGNCDLELIKKIENEYLVYIK